MNECLKVVAATIGHRPTHVLNSNVHMLFLRVSLLYFNIPFIFREREGQRGGQILILIVLSPLVPTNHASLVFHCYFFVSTMTNDDVVILT